MNSNNEGRSPGVGERAPDFVIHVSAGNMTLHDLAARHNLLVVTTQDSYRYHRN